MFSAKEEQYVMKQWNPKKYSQTCLILLCASALILLFSSCATPSTSSRGTISVDEDPIGGGLGSSDVRTVSSRLTPDLLALPEISGSDGPVRVAISPMRNSSRFVMDMNMFMKRLRLELNRYSRGKIRFFSQGRGQITRNEVLQGRDEARLRNTLAAVGQEISELPVFSNTETPRKVGVVPVLNCNFVNMNANSVLAMLRSHVASHASGKFHFLQPDVLDGADYLLTGQFIAESIQTESLVDLSEYIKVVEERLKAGESLSVYDDDLDGIKAEGNTGNQIIVSAGGQRHASILERIAANSSLRNPPNVNKHLSVMLVESDSKVVVYEKMFLVEEKTTQGLELADFVLSGEISGLSKRLKGEATDYLLITMQLVDPDTNELLWEEGYEVQKKSSAGVVYQ